MTSAEPAGQESNTLRVALPKGVTLRAATEALKRFGEVSHVEVLPGQKLAVSVVFFDVRAAANARGVLGSSACEPAPQTGSRSVRLPGSVQIEAAMLHGVSRVDPDPGDDGAYLVEFYDVRDADRVQKLASRLSGEPAGGAPAAAAAEQRREAAEASVPAYVKPSWGSSPLSAAPAAAAAAPTATPTATPTAAPWPQPAPMPASAQAAGQVSVLLRGLPKALCTGACMEAMLEQAGLEGTVVSCRLRRGTSAGEVLLTLATKQAARRCIGHFNGRRWDTSGTSVTACLAKLVGGEAEAEPAAQAPRQAPVQGPPGLERPPKAAGKGPAKDTARELATDESTADGASEGSDQEMLVGQQGWVN